MTRIEQLEQHIIELALSAIGQALDGLVEVAAPGANAGRT
jgi:hypothetical protein